jgi:hypothetical protein
MKNYKMFNIKIFILIPIFLIIFLFVNFFYYKVPNKTLWIYKSFEVKDKYSKSINTKKIVFTSGSNTLYGMETNLVEKELNIPVVNMAIHAGLKTDYILYRVKQILKNNDVIILPFEYENFNWDGENTSTRTDYLLTHDKMFIVNNMNIYEIVKMIISLSPLDTFESFKEQYLPNVKESEIGVGYTSLTLNHNGDETYKEHTKDKILQVKHKPFPIPLEKEPYGLKIIKEFSLWCNENNIKLYVTFPNTIILKEYKEEKYAEYFNNLIEYFKQNNIDIIGKPMDTMYLVEYFYDTRYHMNNKGANLRTKDFINKLNKILK